MVTGTSSALVSTAWLEDHLSDPDVRILDCTWHHASTNLDGRTQYRGRHLPGSVHFDIDHIADKSSSLPHMLPTAEDFAKRVGLLGVGDGDRVIVYDRLCGGSAAARVWWMFRAFGFDNVALLDGGYGKWTQEKRQVDISPVRPEPRDLTARLVPSLLRGFDDVKANISSGAAQLIDARGPAKFDGSQEDVFPQRRRGHIPNAVNIPWGDLIEQSSGTFLPVEALKARFAFAGIDLDRPIIATCASGITSCVLALGLHVMGAPDVAVYDGSWAEWNLQDGVAAEAA
ncbi:MAG: sulfurtransferase [Beijerinckiaceae bacterium]|nr:sulfurtransferase [Beijerinckiaceae bacterium]